MSTDLSRYQRLAETTGQALLALLAQRGHRVEIRPPLKGTGPGRLCVDEANIGYARDGGTVWLAVNLDRRHPARHHWPARRDGSHNVAAMADHVEMHLPAFLKWQAERGRQEAEEAQAAAIMQAHGLVEGFQCKVHADRGRLILSIYREVTEAQAHAVLEALIQCGVLTPTTYEEATPMSASDSLPYPERNTG